MTETRSVDVGGPRQPPSFHRTDGHIDDDRSLSVAQHLVHKLNSQAAIAGIAFLKAAAGIAFIAAGIRDRGSIDVTAPFVTGKLESGFVGVSLLMLSLAALGLLTLTSIKKTRVSGQPLPKDSRAPQELKLEAPHWTITYSGAQFHAQTWEQFALICQRLVEGPVPQGPSVDKSGQPRFVHRDSAAELVESQPNQALHPTGATTTPSAPAGER